MCSVVCVVCASCCLLSPSHSTQTIKDFKLFDDRESAYIFRVPDDLRNLNLQLTAKVRMPRTNTLANYDL